MALPLVLSLTDLLLALAAVVIGLGAVGSHKQRPEASRVLAAAQRGALDLLGSSAPFAGLFLLVFAVGGAVAEGPVQELLTAGLAGTALAIGGAWLAGWQSAVTTARLSRGVALETFVMEMGRLSTTSVLLAAAAGSAVSALCFATLPSAPAKAALMAAATASGLLTILARPGVLSWAAAARVRSAEGLHPGSLAELAGTTFAGPWLGYISVFAASSLGQVGLFVLARDGAHGLGTYALLLPRIGLLALICGGLGARTSARDGQDAGWTRQLVITMTVLCGGAWAARGVLTSDSASSWAPGLVCYLCAAFGFGAWLLGSRRRREQRFAAPLALLPVVLLCLVVDPSELGGSSALLPLLLASGVALLPVAATFRAGASALSAATTCDLLAAGPNEAGQADTSSRPMPSAGQRSLFLPMGLMVAWAASSRLFHVNELGPGGGSIDPLLAGLSAIGVALLLHGTSRQLTALGEEGGVLLTRLAEQRPLDGGLMLGEGLTVLRRIGGEQQLAFALTLLGPPLFITAFGWLNGQKALDLCLGSLVGALFWAALADQPPQQDRARTALSTFVWPLVLYHLCWAALLATS